MEANSFLRISYHALINLTKLKIVPFPALVFQNDNRKMLIYKNIKISKYYCYFMTLQKCMNNKVFDEE